MQPSGTSDAGQTPVPISTLADRTITITNRNYVVGDSAVATWYNAGDFGNGNLGNNDVNNAFHVSLGLYNVYPFTDLFDAMDAFPPDSATTVGGDGQIRFLDWQVILQRSLRLSSGNWQRSWSTGGVRVPASATLNSAADTAGQKLIAPPPGSVWVRQASFSASPLDRVQPGQTVQVPIYVDVDDGSTLSGLQFLAKIIPSPTAPALTAPATFTVASGLPTGQSVPDLAPNQLAYAWDLGSFDPALHGRVELGTITFTVPATATAGQSYLVRFGNADGAPNENTQYDFESHPGDVWVSGAAPATTDPISDEWKVKFFGSVDSPDAAPNADPDNDGVPNWKEYLAGTDPTKADSNLHLSSPLQNWNNGKKQVALRWLSAPGKKYVLESSTDLVNGSWVVIAQGVIGDGTLKQFIDSNTSGTTQYYRVGLQN